MCAWGLDACNHSCAGCRDICVLAFVLMSTTRTVFLGILFGILCTFAFGEEVLVRVGSPLVVYRTECEAGFAHVEIEFSSSQGPASLIFGTQDQCDCVCTSAASVDCGYLGDLSILHHVNASGTLNGRLKSFGRYCALFRNENVQRDTIINYTLKFTCSPDYAILWVFLSIFIVLVTVAAFVVFVRRRRARALTETSSVPNNSSNTATGSGIATDDAWPESQNASLLGGYTPSDPR
jgi:hypothetical protein